MTYEGSTTGFVKVHKDIVLEEAKKQGYIHSINVNFIIHIMF